MLKRLILSLALALGTVLPAHAFGTIPISLTQRFDNSSHLPLAGGLIYFYQAGTTATPQNAFQDSALTIPYANPLTLDAGGNIPQLFFADGLIKVRITNAAGVTQLTQDNIQVIGASSGTGGGGTVDPTTIAATGDLKVAYGISVLSGWVRANGRTIGSATSGATERANADCQALFQYLWAADSSLAVSGGRGASANADWVANKTITLPDLRGRVVAGLDDMGGGDASRLTGSSLTTGRFTLGFAAGESTHLLTVNEMPSHNHGVTDPGHTHSFSAIQPGGQVNAVAGNFGSLQTSVTASSLTGITIQNTGGGSVHNLMQPTMLATYYLKL